MSILQVLNGDKKSITYRPELNKLTKSVTATILLQHLLYLWFQNNAKAFYKYKTPNDKSNGKSLCEELGFSRREFDTALSKISQKVDRLNVITNSFVKHSTDFTRKTWYFINTPYLEECVKNLYKDRGLHEFNEYLNPSENNSTPYALLIREQSYLESCKMQIKGTYDIEAELQKYSDHLIFKGDGNKTQSQLKSGFRNWLRNHMRMNLSSTGERKMVM